MRPTRSTVTVNYGYGASSGEPLNHAPYTLYGYSYGYGAYSGEPLNHALHALRLQLPLRLYEASSDEPENHAPYSFCYSSLSLCQFPRVHHTGATADWIMEFWLQIISFCDTTVVFYGITDQAQGTSPLEREVL